MHRMFNIVTGPRESPQAVLVRAVKITAGQELVRRRRKGIAEKDWASGAGRVCTALGIEMQHNRHDLLAGEIIWIEDRGLRVPPREVKRTPAHRCGLRGRVGEEALAVCVEPAL